jgi:hypothetical protein
MSGVWNIEKRQLLVDSVLNGYDIPKIYFHELVPAKRIGKRIYKYSIIDGKQRLEALWGFIDGKFALDRTFEYMDDTRIGAGVLTYADLGAKYPQLKTRFDSTSLAIVSVRTEDVELIEDMFSRLNEAVPLNAAEKRNALGGPIPPLIRQLSDHEFFKRCLPFTNARYRHFDLACKFLYFEANRGLKPTYKIHLDAFVREFRSESKERATRIYKASSRILDQMSREFIGEDDLLRSTGNVVIYYMLFRKAIPRVKRERLLEFEEAREVNRELAEKNLEEASFDLLEFDRLLQSPNDEASMRTRLKVLKDFLASPKPKRVSRH